jgi:3-carboxy-cis,cis-muconate cycloisomerase
MTPALFSQIFGGVFADPAVVELLSDRAYVRRLLEVEAALARAQAELGIIPGEAADAIERAAATLEVDLAALAAGVRRDGVPVVALIEQLRSVLGPEVAPFVHRGATTQDIVDTAAVLAARSVLAHLDAGLGQLARELGRLAEEHRGSVMAARTHAQHALPTSFGLKVVGWALPLARHHERLRELLPRLAVLSLGGAAGTLLAFGARAPELEERLGRRLGLAVPELPWHTQRDAIAELGAWLALLTGSLGKLAQDVILLCQSEVAELSEAQHGRRGGSSSMPQKNNPMRSEQILAAARVVAAESSALMHALVQEHERGTHGWQVEWLCLSPMALLASGALAGALELVRELVVYPERMRENLLREHGLALAEPAVVALSRALDRAEASALVRTAAGRALAEQRFLVDVLREAVEAKYPALRLDWAGLARLDDHMGQASTLIDRALARIHRTFPVESASRS